VSAIAPRPFPANAKGRPSASGTARHLVTEGFLGEVATLAAGIQSPPASCGVSLRRDGETFTVAGSDARAMQVDEAQYGWGEGPCLDALNSGEITDAPDLVDDTRWGDYRNHVLAQGFRSVLSLPLTIDGVTIGALNLYGEAPRAFSDGQRSRAEGFAAQAATGLTLTLRHANQVELSEQLQQALLSRALIDQALGVVMAQQRCTADAAFAVLRTASQNRNRKLRDVAADIIEAVSGQPPQPTDTFTRR